MSARGALLLVGVLVLETAALIAIAWGASRLKVPIWLRWLAGATSYLAYFLLASHWLPVIWSGMVVSVSAAIGRALLCGRTAGCRPHERWAVVGLAWIALAFVPALFLFVSRMVLRGGRAYRGTGTK